MLAPSLWCHWFFSTVEQTIMELESEPWRLLTSWQRRSKGVRWIKETRITYKIIPPVTYFLEASPSRVSIASQAMALRVKHSTYGLLGNTSYLYSITRKFAYCCVTFSFEIETFYTTGEILKLEGKQTRIVSGSPWKLSDLLGPSLPRVNNKGSWEFLSVSQAITKILRQDQMLGRNRNQPN